MQALSNAGRCQTFETSADGYGRGEGFTAVVLRQAGSASDSLAIVRGSAVNQDGRSSSLTAPNGPSQQVELPSLFSQNLNTSAFITSGFCFFASDERLLRLA